jgi:hypothetical protein
MKSNSKRIIILLAYLLPMLVAKGQYYQITANRVFAGDSLRLVDRWLRKITTNLSSSDSNSHNMIPTNRAVMDAIHSFGGGGGGPVQSEFSIIGSGTGADKLKLTNDALSPGNNKIYGTNYSGTKGYVDPDISWYNIVKAGADNTGAVDVSSYIIAALNIGFKNIYLPDGIFFINSTVQMKDSVIIRGAGRGRTIIKLTSNITAFKLSYALGGNKCQFLDFDFKGTNGTSGNTSENGIVCDSVHGVYINNVGAYRLAGYLATIKNNGLVIASYIFGNTITDCYAESCIGGVYFDVRGEYNVVGTSTFAKCTYGVRVAGGNNRVIANNMSEGTYGLYLEAGSNDGHGEAIGNTVNHNSTSNLYITGLLNGFDITGNDFYVGAITIINSTLVQIMGGDIDENTITVTNCTKTNFIHNKWVSEPTWVVTGNSPGVVRFDEASTQGLIVRDPDNNSNFNISNNNGVVTMGSASVGQVNMASTLVGKTGSFDGGRDLCVGKARFDLGSTTGDGVQVYKTGTNGATFNILDTAARYAFYAHPGGRFGIGANLSNPRATMHVSGTVRFDLGSDATGDILYRNANGLLAPLPIGTNNQVLTVSSGVLSWQTPAAAPDSGIWKNDVTMNDNHFLSGNNKVLSLGTNASKLSLLSLYSAGRIEIFGQPSYSTDAINTDANYTVPANIAVVELLDNLTADRTVTLPTPAINGQCLTIVARFSSGSNHFNLSSAIVDNKTGSTFTQLDWGATYDLMVNASIAWYLVRKY